MKSKKGLLSLLAIAVLLLVGFNFYLINHRNKEQQELKTELVRAEKLQAKKDAAQAKNDSESTESQKDDESQQVASQVKKSPQVTENENESSNYNRSNSGNAADTTLHHLASYEGKYPEDPDTVTGGDPTYSRFYINSDNSWSWQLLSDRRGIVEQAQVVSGQVNGAGMDLQMKSDTHDGHRYRLSFMFGNGDGYQLSTPFLDISGSFYKP